MAMFTSGNLRCFTKTKLLKNGIEMCDSNRRAGKRDNDNDIENYSYCFRTCSPINAR